MCVCLQLFLCESSKALTATARCSQLLCSYKVFLTQCFFIPDDGFVDDAAFQEAMNLGRSKDDVIEEQRRIFNELHHHKGPSMSQMSGSFKESRESKGSKEIKRKEAYGSDTVSAEVHRTPSQPVSKVKSQDRNVNPLYEFNRSTNGKLSL